MIEQERAFSGWQGKSLDEILNFFSAQRTHYVKKKKKFFKNSVWR